MLHGADEVVVLDELKQAEQMMSRTEVGHEFQGFAQFGADVRGLVRIKSRMPAWSGGARLKFLAGVFIMSQEADRAAVQRFAKPAHCLGRVVAFRREQAQAFERQGAGW